MRVVFNRIVISLIIIGALAALCEFYLRPVSAPIYRAAVADYARHQYSRSLEELNDADAFDPNDPSVLALMGWNSLRLAKPKLASRYFRQACRMAPNDPDPLLGSIYAEISLEEYANALQLVREFERKHGETHALEIACGVLSRQMKLAHRTNPQRIIDPNTRLHGSR